MREERTRLRLTHEKPNEWSDHIFKNFGEELWALTRADRRWTVDIEEIDHTAHCFHVDVRSSVLKRSLAFVDTLLLKHRLSDKVRIDVLGEG